MTDRRHVLFTMGALAMLPMISSAANNAAPGGHAQSKPILLAAIGPALHRYQLDPQIGSLADLQVVTLPTDIFYACFHPSARSLYVIGSDAEMRGRRGPPTHYLTTLRIDQGTGELVNEGTPRVLPAFANHVTTDPQGTLLLLACHAPSMVLAYAIEPGGSLGDRVVSLSEEAVGTFAHQVAVAPSGSRAIVCARGNDPGGGRAEARGALTMLNLEDRDVVPRGTIEMPSGLGPRNLDFHPSKPWFYVGMERGNQLAMYTWREPMPEARFLASTLARPETQAPRQRVGAVRVHPDGQTLYVANRADRITRKGDRAVFAGGENSIAVFSLDKTSGKPTLIQHIDTGGIEPRSFDLDATGTLLAVGNQTAFHGEAGGKETSLPASVALFGIESDGTLRRESVHPVEGSGLLWVGFMPRRKS
jgi:6-phosphogluconolactonase